MRFSSGDKALIKNLYRFKNSFWRILAEFLRINCNREKVGMLLTKIWKSCSIDHRLETGRLKHRRTGMNVITVDEMVGLQDYTVFHKRHPFSFFHNSVKWWPIYTKFLPDVAEEILIRNIWTKYGWELNVLCESWRNADVIVCCEYKLACCNWCWQTCWIAALHQWQTLSGSLMTLNCWNFTIAATKTPKTITLTYL